MTCSFLQYDIEKKYGKEYANRIRSFKYNLLRHYGVSNILCIRARSWTLPHIIQLINTHYEEKVILNK